MNPKVAELKSRPQPVQRSQEWYLERQRRITASEAASCLYKSKASVGEYVEEFRIENFKYKDTEGLNPYESREDYIIKKCAAFYGEHNFKDNAFTLWGKKYEEVANRLYMQLNGCTVHEFGLISHAGCEWLAASPDGITEEGVMLEIKCPKSRKINEDFIPLYYWVQVQIQLETCDLDECDFFECEIAECASKESWVDDVKNIKDGEKKSFGIVLRQPGEGEPSYVYPPLEITTIEGYFKWEKQTRDENPQLLETTYFIVEKYHTTRIKRSKLWFDGVKKDLIDAWEIVTRLQEDKESFKKYKDSIHQIKSASFYKKFHSTICEIETEESLLLEDDSDDESVDMDNRVEVDTSVCLIE